MPNGTSYCLLPWAWKPVGNPVRKPLTDLDCKPLPDGGPDGVALLGREHLKPLRKSICKLLPQLVRKPLPDHAADGGALLGRKRGKPIHSSPADLSRYLLDGDARSGAFPSNR